MSNASHSLADGSSRPSGKKREAVDPQVARYDAQQNEFPSMTACLLPKEEAACDKATD